jgi:DNA-binding NarL/FixJ family response regulator
MKVKILVVCANPDILKVILRLINANESWEAVGTSTFPEAIDVMPTDKFDLLLIGSGLTEAEEQALIEYVQSEMQDTRIIQHYGGGSGLLSAEIYQALS